MNNTSPKKTPMTLLSAKARALGHEAVLTGNGPCSKCVLRNWQQKNWSCICKRFSTACKECMFDHLREVLAQ